MRRLIDISPEAFADGDETVISYKGNNYHRACDVFVSGHPDGGSEYCVKPVGHPSKVHESYNGATRSD